MAKDQPKLAAGMALMSRDRKFEGQTVMILLRSGIEDGSDIDSAVMTLLEQTVYYTKPVKTPITFMPITQSKQ